MRRKVGGAHPVRHRTPPPPAAGGPGWRPTGWMEKALAILISHPEVGSSQVRLARAVGVSDRTVRKWFSIPDFRVWWNDQLARVAELTLGPAMMELRATIDDPETPRSVKVRAIEVLTKRVSAPRQNPAHALLAILETYMGPDTDLRLGARGDTLALELKGVREDGEGDLAPAIHNGDYQKLEDVGGAKRLSLDEIEAAVQMTPAAMERTTRKLVAEARVEMGDEASRLLRPDVIRDGDTTLSRVVALTKRVPKPFISKGIGGPKSWKKARGAEASDTHDTPNPPDPTTSDDTPDNPEVSSSIPAPDSSTSCSPVDRPPLDRPLRDPEEYSGSATPSHHHPSHPGSIRRRSPNGRRGVLRNLDVCAADPVLPLADQLAADAGPAASGEVCTRSDTARHRWTRADAGLLCVHCGVVRLLRRGEDRGAGGSPTYRTRPPADDRVVAGDVDLGPERV